MGAAQITLERPTTDPRIAGSRATFALPQGRLGVVPGWRGAAWLVEAVGRGRAVDLLATGDHTVVPAGQAEIAARAVVEQARTASRDALRDVKPVVDSAATAGDAARIFAALWVGDDHRAAEVDWWDRRQRVATDPPR